MDKSNISFEPMDIDLSNNSAGKMDISNSEPPREDAIIIKEEKLPPEKHTSRIIDSTSYETIEDAVKIKSERSIKKFHIKIQKREKKSYISLSVLPVVFVLCVSIITYLVMNFKCTEELDLKRVKEILSTNLYGQTKAIDAIVESLDTKIKSKILFFYGGSGVGKTFAASLILENLWTSSNIYHYTMPSFISTFSSDFLLGLTICKTSILIVDDLTMNDMHIQTQIKEIIDKSEYLGKNITILLVYNCDNVTGNFVKKCDKSFYAEMKEKFDKIDALKIYIRFESLTDEHLRKCIEKELGISKVSGHDIDNIMKHFNVSFDGCKGVHSRIKFLKIT